MFIICSCTATNTPDIHETSLTDNDGEKLVEIQALNAPYSFNSFEDYEQHEKRTKANAASCYYTPSSLPPDYELAHITKRDDVYVMIEYSLSVQTVSDNELSEYDAERLQTLICRYSLYPDGQKALEDDFISNGYEAIEYEGQTYYRWDEHAENNPEKRVIGYEIAFLDEGNLIFMHLPAIDTFENMMKYANVVKTNIV